MSLSLYKKKRSFKDTPEPAGSGATNKKGALLFVVQQHHASHRHFDFRLEMKGVLKSWAVPKGPSMDPGDKRLAMMVEDHPFDYKDFEGIIPKGNYGAGTVIVWDTGTYSDAGQPDADRTEQEKKLLRDLYKGRLHIRLDGEKLKGDFTLVKTANGEENAWLLMKKKDRNARKSDITKKNKSVLSGMTIEEMASNKSAARWSSNRSSNGELKKNLHSKVDLNAPTDVHDLALSTLKNIKGKKKAAYPRNLKPMLATLTDTIVEGPDWSYEIKWDGYRALAYLNGARTDLRSRNNNSFADQFYPVFEALKDWKLKAVVDGEIVAVNEQGVSSFQQLQNWRSETDGELLYYVFDLIWLEGYDLTALPLVERRAILRQLVPAEGLVRFSENFETNAQDFLDAAQKIGIEGMIAKKNDSLYSLDNRSKEWLKIKTGRRHEAVIGGFTKNKDSSKLFSSLLLGVYEGKNLRFIGQAGTGYSDLMQKDIMKKLKPLIVTKCPFEQLPEVNKPSRFRPRPPQATVTWVKPRLVGEVQYQELTDEGIMRHPSFQGLRTDKKASEVVMEEAQDIKQQKKATKLVAENIKPVKAGSRKTLVNPHEKTQVKKIDGHELKFTNLDKLYWPKEKIRKGDMLNYYYQVAPYMLPYMKDRPQSLNRFPNGINGEGFYQKNVAGKMPSWLATHDYENTTSEGKKKFLVCKDEATLIYMANLGCIEMNPWHSRVQSPDKPDWCVIDLDPDTNPFSQVIETANVIHDILTSIDVPSFPKTSGSTGIHIYIPLGAKYDYEQSKMLAELIVGIAHRELTSFTSLERSPSKRKGLIYLDFLQNRAIQTIAAPYSLRPKPGATASAPLHWEEVKTGLKIADFTITTLPARLKEQGDIFRGVLGKGIDMQKVLKKINSVFGE